MTETNSFKVGETTVRNVKKHAHLRTMGLQAGLLGTTRASRIGSLPFPFVLYAFLSCL